VPVYKDNKRNTWYIATRKRDIQGNLKYIKKRGFKTRKEAQIAEASLILTMTEKKQTFKELYFNYIEYQKNKLKPRSLQCMVSRFELHLLPYFQNKDITKINTKDIVEWQNIMNDKQYSAKYKNVIHTHLSSILKYACQHYGLKQNVASIVGGFKDDKVKNKIEFWTYEEFEQFISAVDDLTYKTFFSLLYYTGLRLGEALALNWNDINNDTLSVNKTISQRLGVITSPKTKSSVREVLMPLKVVNLLKEHYNKESSIKGFEDKWFIFGGFRPLAETTITRKKDHYCKLANVKRIKIHDFRHSHASLLINKGANPTIVAQRLGHSDIAMTLNTYSHMMPNSQKEVINLLDN
jgi:integrase